jgi:hypothetical protein
MPEFLSRIFTRNDVVPDHQLEGFQGNGAVHLRDRRGALKAEVPDIAEKGMHGMGDDPSSKAMANFTGWTFAAVNAITSEVANI